MFVCWSRWVVGFGGVGLVDLRCGSLSIERMDGGGVDVSWRDEER